MPRPRPVLPMSMDEFDHMPHWLGWKHEYWDGAAQLSPQETAVVALQRRVEVMESRVVLAEGEELRQVRAEDEAALVELFQLAFDDAVEYAGWPQHSFREEARDSVGVFFGRKVRYPHLHRDRPRPEVSFVITASAHPKRTACLG